MRLNDALSEMLEGWLEDLSPAWREVFEGVELGIDDVDADLHLRRLAVELHVAVFLT